MASSSVSGLDMSRVQEVSRQWDLQRKPLEAALHNRPELVQYLDTLPWNVLVTEKDFRYDPVEGLCLGIRSPTLLGRHLHSRAASSCQPSVTFHRCPRRADLQQWAWLARELPQFHRTEPLGDVDNLQSILMAVFYELPFAWNTKYTANAYKTASETRTLKRRSCIVQLQEKMKSDYDVEKDAALKEGRFRVGRLPVATADRRRRPLLADESSTTRGKARPTMSGVLPLRAAPQTGAAALLAARQSPPSREAANDSDNMDRRQPQKGHCKRTPHRGNAVAALYTSDAAGIDVAVTPMSPCSMSSHFEIPGDNDYDYDDRRTSRRSSSPVWEMDHVLRPDSAVIATNPEVASDRMNRISGRSPRGFRSTTVSHDDGIVVLVPKKRPDVLIGEKHRQKQPFSGNASAHGKRRSRKRKRRQKMSMRKEVDDEEESSNETMSTIIAASIPSRSTLPTPEPESDFDWDEVLDSCMLPVEESDSEPGLRKLRTPSATPSVSIDEDNENDIESSKSALLEAQSSDSAPAPEPRSLPLFSSSYKAQEEVPEQLSRTRSSVCTSRKPRDKACLLQRRPSNSYPPILANHGEIDLARLEQSVHKTWLAMRCLNILPRTQLLSSDLEATARRVADDVRCLGRMVGIASRTTLEDKGNRITTVVAPEKRKPWPAEKPYPSSQQEVVRREE